jgi:deoxyadenosine/deoxycytidine kinase
MATEKLHVVCVEGNIASGKSTLLQSLIAEGYTCFTENVAKWEPFLQKMYTSKESDMLQLRICADNAFIMRSIAELDPNSVKRLPCGKPVVFIERWVGAAEHVFLRCTTSADHLTITPEGMTLWNDFVEITGLRTMPINMYVYVKCAPEIGHKRLVDRARTRNSEKNVALDYIVILNQMYKAFIDRLVRQKNVVLEVENNDTNVDGFILRAKQAIFDNI